MPIGRYHPPTGLVDVGVMRGRAVLRRFGDTKRRASREEDIRAIAEYRRTIWSGKRATVWHRIVIEHGHVEGVVSHGGVLYRSLVVSLRLLVHGDGDARQKDDEDQREDQRRNERCVVEADAVVIVVVARTLRVRVDRAGVHVLCGRYQTTSGFVLA